MTAKEANKAYAKVKATCKARNEVSIDGSEYRVISYSFANAHTPNVNGFAHVRGMNVCKRNGKKRFYCVEFFNAITGKISYSTPFAS